MGTPNQVWPEYSISGFLKTFRDMAAGSLSPSDVRIIAILVLGYFLTGELGLILIFPDPGATMVWLPAGIALAAVLLRGNRVWPGIFVGAFLVNVMCGMHIPASTAIALEAHWKQ